MCCSMMGLSALPQFCINRSIDFLANFYRPLFNCTFMHKYISQRLLDAIDFYDCLTASIFPSIHI
uniref:Uncharacterized protein n=1 Tax=Arundo donax TaxID=35708 RepID=A0A0A9CQT4_ARUDO